MRASPVSRIIRKYAHPTANGISTLEDYSATAPMGLHYTVPECQPTRHTYLVDSVLVREIQKACDSPLPLATY